MADGYFSKLRKYKPWLFSLLGGSALILFWSYLDQAQRDLLAGMKAAADRQAALQPPPTVQGAGDIPSSPTPAPAAVPSVPGSLYGDDGGEWGDGEGEDGRSGYYRPTPTPAPTPAPAPTPTPTPAPAVTESIYKNGTYRASSQAPWGPMTIELTVAGGKWTDITAVETPNSPPSFYAVGYLVQQALAAQSDAINGVSGATYTSDAFRDDLRQIIKLSKR